MENVKKKKLKNYRVWNFILDLYFTGLLVLLAIVGGFVFYSGCISVKEYFTDSLKEKWELIALPIGIVWLYFNLRGIYYMLYMIFSPVQKQIIVVTEKRIERITTGRGSYRVLNVYYEEGFFELGRYQSDLVSVGQRCELWYKPERKGKARRNVKVFSVES